MLKTLRSTKRSKVSAVDADGLTNGILKIL
jgi:hypothetical protein